MADVFEYIAEANQCGIIKLHALADTWDSAVPEIPVVRGSGGTSAAAILELTQQFSGIHTTVSELFSKTIAFLEKVDENFRLDDTSQAAALVLHAKVQAMADQRIAVFEGASSGWLQKFLASEPYKVISAVAGTAGTGLSGFINSADTAAVAAVAGAQTSGSWFKKFLSNDLKVGGSVISHEVSTTGEFMGATTGGTAGYDVLTGEAKIELEGNWDIEDGDAGVTVEASAEGTILQGEAKGNIGIVSGGVEGAVGVASAEAHGTLNLMTGGEFNPALEVGAKAEVEGIKGKVEVAVGNDDYDVHGSASGTVGKAAAEAKLGISKDGISGKAEVGAAALSGSATGGITIFGIHIDATVKGELAAVGAEASFGVEKDSVELGGKLSFLAGLGLKIKISW